MHFTMYVILSVYNSAKVWDTSSDKYYAIAKMKEKNGQNRDNGSTVRVYIAKLTRG